MGSDHSITHFGGIKQSGQISKSDLTRPHPKWWWVSKGNALQGNLGEGEILFHLVRTMQMYGKFGWFPLNGALFGLVSFSWPLLDGIFFHQKNERPKMNNNEKRKNEMRCSPQKTKRKIIWTQSITPKMKKIHLDSKSSWLRGTQPLVFGGDKWGWLVKIHYESLNKIRKVNPSKNGEKREVEGGFLFVMCI